jgi:hypothetical protein
MSRGDEILGLQSETRRQVWAQTVDLIERYYEDVGKGPIGPVALDPGSLRKQLQEFTFTEPIIPSRAVEFAAEGLWKYQRLSEKGQAACFWRQGLVGPVKRRSRRRLIPK